MKMPLPLTLVESICATVGGSDVTPVEPVE